MNPDNEISLGRHINSVEAAFYHQDLNTFDTDSARSREVSRGERWARRLLTALFVAEFLGISFQFLTPDVEAFNEDVHRALSEPRPVGIAGGEGGPEPPSPAHPPGQEPIPPWAPASPLTPTPTPTPENMNTIKVCMQLPDSHSPNFWVVNSQGGRVRQQVIKSSPSGCFDVRFEDHPLFTEELEWDWRYPFNGRDHVQVPGGRGSVSVEDGDVIFLPQ